MTSLPLEECRRSESVRETINNLLGDTNRPLQETHFLNLRESMRNGGGPACLRNRIILNEKEINLLPKAIILDNVTIDSLIQWIDHHDRDQLELEQIPIK